MKGGQTERKGITGSDSEPLKSVWWSTHTHTQIRSKASLPEIQAAEQDEWLFSSIKHPLKETHWVCVCVIWIQTHWHGARRQEMAKLQGSLRQLGLAEHHIKLHVIFDLFSFHAFSPHPAADATENHLAQHGRYRTCWEQTHPLVCSCSSGTFRKTSTW